MPWFSPLLCLTCWLLPAARLAGLLRLFAGLAERSVVPLRGGAGVAVEPRRPVPAALDIFVRFLDVRGGTQLAAEVRRVQLPVQDGFVDFADLGEGELGAQEVVGDGAVFDLVPQPP